MSNAPVQFRTGAFDILPRSRAPCKNYFPALATSGPGSFSVAGTVCKYR